MVDVQVCILVYIDVARNRLIVIVVKLGKWKIKGDDR